MSVIDRTLFHIVFNVCSNNDSASVGMNKLLS